MDTTTASTVQHYDEYGVALDGTGTTTYGSLGGYQRSTRTLSGVTLMGARLYNPATGRFLSVDPLRGGNSNAYGYPADPVNKYDLDGRKVIKKYNKTSFSCGYWSCTMTLSRKKTDWFIDIVTGAGKAAMVASAIAALFPGVSWGTAVIIAAATFAVSDFITWYLGYLLKRYPRRGTKIVKPHIGPVLCLAPIGYAPSNPRSEHAKKTHPCFAVGQTGSRLPAGRGSPLVLGPVSGISDAARIP
ncbi:hypothetical protein OG288_36885 [Streptomyces tauricus]|uniref:RHS repeat-associated core domain-containing protein n=1 Tax=Streptomyces tauricus TaxID=68274 RepID=A0ABZ1JUA2_9ACTN